MAPVKSERARSGLLLALVMLAGCALTSKAEPREDRYFSLESHAPAEVTPRVETGRVRLGRITASSYLRYPIEHRASAVEIAPYYTLRWAELPDAYARRALARALFELHPLAQIVSGPGPTLDVEVVAFEQIVRGGHPAGRASLRYELRAEDRVITRGLVTAERDAASPQIEAVVTAIGAALDDAAGQVADRISPALTQSP